VAKDSGSMWLDMLGLGGIASTINDPNFQAQVQAFAAAQFATLEAVQRIETKLDRLLGVQNGLDAVGVPGRDGTDGTGKSAFAGLAFDDGTCADASGHDRRRFAGGA